MIKQSPHNTSDDEKQLKLISKKLDDAIRRLDILSILLLVDKGLSQKEIAKALGISSDKIQDIFGKSYSKIQSIKESGKE